jgi:signal peptidase I
MAETLYGYQKIVTCPQCGLEFPVNASIEVEGHDGPGGRGKERAAVTGCTCPNCRFNIRFDSSIPKGLTKNPVPFSGDRVLVAKYVYDALEGNPARMDVVVFKFPGDYKGPGDLSGFPYDSGPVKRHVPMNYIKRLVGLPGETIAIHRGKLYVLKAEHALSYDDVEKAKASADPAAALAMLWTPPHMHSQLWSSEDLAAIKKAAGDKEGSESDLRQAREKKAVVDRFGAGQFEIVRKKPEVLLAMMRLVYDNDHPAADLAGEDFQRWVGERESGWSAADDARKTLTHDGGAKMGWLRYRHVLRDAPPDEEQGGRKRSLITDFMGYNTYQGGSHGAAPKENWVSDLIVECTAKVDQLKGRLVLELSKGPDRFQADFDLEGQQCSLKRLNDQGEVQLASAPSKIRKAGSYQLRFANVDDKLTVWVDGKVLFADDQGTYEPAKGLVPVEKNDLEPVSVGAQGARVTLSQLKVFRDTYYTTATPTTKQPGAGDVEIDPSNSATWPKLKDAPVATYYVQPDHYLCLGDNSPESSDGRSWGLVPRRLMLGKALLVYYPFGRAGRIR